MTHEYVVQFDTIYEYTWNLVQNIFSRNNPIVTFLQGQSRMSITNLFQFIIFEQEFNYTTWTRPCLGNLFFLWPDSLEPCAAACHSVAGRISWYVCTYSYIWMGPHLCFDRVEPSGSLFCLQCSGAHQTLCEVHIHGPRRAVFELWAQNAQ